MGPPLGPAGAASCADIKFVWKGMRVKSSTRKRGDLMEYIWPVQSKLKSFY